MNRIQATAVAFLLIVAHSARGQAPNSAELASLRDRLEAQDRLLRAQEQQLQSQRQQIAELKALVNAALEPKAAQPTPEAAAITTPPASAQGRIFNPTQEVAGEKPEGNAIEVGAAQLRIGGYFGLTGIYRSVNAGGGPGTNFGAIPFPTRPEGNLSETRLSASSSRLSIRADAPFPDGIARFRRLSGYFEMDFNGDVPGNIAVTSHSAGLRLRHAFGEAQYSNNWLLAVGQAFSLMTPQRDQISVWPSDVEMSQAVDTNYLAGMVWGRIPQVRVTWRPSRTFNWAYSLENPEQQLGRAGVVQLPACCSADIQSEFNTGGDGLTTPNLMPDLTTRVAFNRGRFHLDAGGVLRVFRQSLQPYTHSGKQLGGGGNVNGSIRLGAAKLILQGAYGAGLGRYLGGLVPDVAFKPDGSISPILSGSWVAGIENNITRNATLSLYYSGIYSARSFFLDRDGRTYIGYGYPGSPDSNNRAISEWTGVWAYRIIKTERRGSVQWNNELSWISRSPWARLGLLGSTSAFQFITQLRYNLP